jgi:hypothetical protein
MGLMVYVYIKHLVCVLLWFMEHHPVAGASLRMDVWKKTRAWAIIICDGHITAVAMLASLVRLFCMASVSGKSPPVC